MVRTDEIQMLDHDGLNRAPQETTGATGAHREPRGPPAPQGSRQRSQIGVGGSESGGSTYGSSRTRNTGAANDETAEIAKVFETLDARETGTAGEWHLGHMRWYTWDEAGRSSIWKANFEDQFRRVDTDRDDQITLLELVQWLTSIRNSSENLTTRQGVREEVQRLFGKFADSRNEITKTSFLRSARRFVPDFSDDLLVCMFQEFQNSRAVIGMEEFVQIGQETSTF